MSPDFEVVLRTKSWSFLNGKNIRKQKGIMECGKWTNDVVMYAELVVIFQKSRKCFRGHQVIVYFKMEREIWGQKYGQLISGQVLDSKTISIKWLIIPGEPCTGYPTTSLYAPVNGFLSWATLGDRMCFRCAPAVLQGVEGTGTEH